MGMGEVYVVYLWRNVLGIFSSASAARKYIETESSLTPGERESCVIDRMPLCD